MTGYTNPQKRTIADPDDSSKEVTITTDGTEERLDAIVKLLGASGTQVTSTTDGSDERLDAIMKLLGAGGTQITSTTDDAKERLDAIIKVLGATGTQITSTTDGSDERLDAIIKLLGAGGTQVTSTTEGSNERLDTSTTIVNDAGTLVTVTQDGDHERLDVNGLVTDEQYPGPSIREFLEDIGSPDMNVDGSSTPVNFDAGPGAGKVWYIRSVTIIMEDTGMNFAKFGGLTALTNGVDFKIKENGGSLVTLANIKTNGGFYAFANNVLLESSTTDFLVAYINAYQNTGTTMKLNGDDSDYFRMVVNDDLTGLDKFNVIIRGYEVDA